MRFGTGIFYYFIIIWSTGTSDTSFSSILNRVPLWLQILRSYSYFTVFIINRRADRCIMIFCFIYEILVSHVFNSGLWRFFNRFYYFFSNSNLAVFWLIHFWRWVFSLALSFETIASIFFISLFQDFLCLSLLLLASFDLCSSLITGLIAWLTMGRISSSVSGGVFWHIKLLVVGFNSCFLCLYEYFFHIFFSYSLVGVMSLTFFPCPFFFSLKYWNFGFFFVFR